MQGLLSLLEGSDNDTDNSDIEDNNHSKSDSDTDNIDTDDTSHSEEDNYTECFIAPKLEIQLLIRRLQ